MGKDFYDFFCQTSGYKSKNGNVKLLEIMYLNFALWYFGLDFLKRYNEK